MADTKTPIKSVRRIVKMSDLVRTADGKLDLSWNYRETDAYNLDRLRPLLEDIRQSREEGVGYNGVRDPITVMEEPVYDPADPSKVLRTELRILQGHRRAVCLDLDRMEKIEANVFPKLDDQTAMIYMLDVNRESLTHVELVKAIFRGLDSGLTEKQIASQLRPILSHYYKITSDQQKKLDKATDKEEWYKNRWKGVIQMHKRAYDAPDVVRDAWLEKVKQDRVWPRAEEVKEASEIFRQEALADPMLNKQNPGPKFWEFWNALMAEVERAAEEGNAPKNTSSKGRKALEAMYASTPSPIFKLLLLNIMGDPRVSDKDVKETIEPVQAVIEAAGLKSDLLEKIRKIAAKRVEETPEAAKPNGDVTKVA